MADRFNANSNIGISFSYKTGANWILGLGGEFIFGPQPKETSMLDHLKTSAGYIIGTNGEYADIRLYERGFSIDLTIGKIFPLFGPNKNSGILFRAGPGFLQHRIRIEDPNNVVPQLDGDYKKGYDRLTNGPEISTFLGYVYLGNRKLINFWIGGQLNVGFTMNRRSYNFDTRSNDPTHRTDILLGIKGGWILPLYKKMPDPFYYH